MTPLQFEHERTRRALKIRQAICKAVEVRRVALRPLERAMLASRKATLRLQVSTGRLARCMESHQL